MALKVIGAGLGRTGTLSLKVALEQLGYGPCYHMAEVLMALDTIYHLNHKGEVGHYLSSVEKDGAIVVRCETPYPRSFERGLVEGISHNPRLLKPGERFQVRYTDGPPGGRLTCTLHVKAL